MNIISFIFLIAGGFFYTAGGLGLFRMPCLYTRAQAGTKATTLGTILTLVGVGFVHPEWLPKLILIIIFIVLTNPVGSSTLLRSAYKSGVKSTAKLSRDELKTHYDKEAE
ncbi:MAG: monovalent cation/H(+) antiporter subunit G [Clostridiales bacterium]|nr:monovalent cation/H(+) antiporter subunit G [Clostridiales bacterium]